MITFIRVGALLKDSEAKFQTLLEAANDGITVVEGATVSYVNSRLATLLGQGSPTDLDGDA